MVAVPLIAIAAAGLVATVVKVVQHHIEKHNLLKPNTNNSTSDSRELSTLLTANILINGKVYTFVKDTSQVYAHYDLAIDYCTTNAKELGLSVESVRNCIYPLSNIIYQEFQELVDQHKKSKNPAAIAERSPKELIIVPQVSAPPTTEPEPNGKEKDKTEDKTPPFPHSGDPPSTSEASPKEGRYQIVLEINGINYVFEYLIGMDPIEASAELANNFCTLKGKDLLGRYFELNQITDQAKIAEALYNRCYLPLQSSLLTKIHEESEAQSTPPAVTA